MTLVPLYATVSRDDERDAVAWMLLEGAAIADTKLAKLATTDADHAFYTGKIAAALFYARTVLPAALQKATSMGDEDRSPIDMPEAAFATVWSDASRGLSAARADRDGPRGDGVPARSGEHRGPARRARAGSGLASATGERRAAR